MLKSPGGRVRVIHIVLTTSQFQKNIRVFFVALDVPFLVGKGVDINIPIDIPPKTNMTVGKHHF